MADYPAMPLWTDAYLADTTHLSDAEHGRYLMLLVHLWRMPHQRVPNDDAWLARKFGRSIEQVQKELRPLIHEFCQTDGNWIWQKRLKREFSYVRRTSQKQSERAKSRWKKEKDESHGNATRGNAPTPTPTPTDKPPAPTEHPPFEKGGRQRGHRLSSDWKPSEADIVYARNQGMDDLRIKRTALDFRDYWTAKTGQGASKLDWAATWRTWVRRELERNPTGGQLRGRSENFLDAAYRDISSAFSAQEACREASSELQVDSDGWEVDDDGLRDGVAELLPAHRRQGSG